MKKSTKTAAAAVATLVCAICAFGGIMLGSFRLLDWLSARYVWFFDAVGFFLLLAIPAVAICLMFVSAKRDFAYLDDQSEDEQP